MISYLTGLTIVWAVGLLVYALLLRPVASHGYNRAYLLLVLTAGLIAPGLPGWSSGAVGFGGVTEGTTVWLATLTVHAAGNGTQAAATFSWGTLGDWVWYGYLFGLAMSVLLTGRLVYGLVECFGESRPLGRVDEMLVRELPTADGPFSVGRHLFVKEWSAYTPADARALVSHETAHHRLGHTYDRALVTLIRTVLWFHPLVYLIDRELRLVHEYHADAEALNSIELNSYRRLLLAHQLHTRQPLLAAAFAQSPLQNRFAMMTKTFQTKQSWRVALATAVVLFAAAACTKDGVDEADLATLTAAQAEGLSADDNLSAYMAGVERGLYRLSIDTIDMFDPETYESTLTVVYNFENPDGHVKVFSRTGAPAVGTEPAPSIEVVRNRAVLKTAEVMPHFPDASCVNSDNSCYETALLRHIYSNISYPKLDRDAGTEGKVIVQFVVGTDGELLEPKVLRSPSESMSAEVLRVIDGMPAWVPGKQDGRDVQVSFVLPVQFQLE